MLGSSITRFSQTLINQNATKASFLFLKNRYSIHDWSHIYDGIYKF
jgi:hypothetical protein